MKGKSASFEASTSKGSKAKKTPVILHNLNADDVDDGIIVVQDQSVEGQMSEKEKLYGEQLTKTLRSCVQHPDRLCKIDKHASHVTPTAQQYHGWVKALVCPC